MHYFDAIFLVGMMTIYGSVICLIFWGIVKIISILVKSAVNLRSKYVDVLLFFVGLFIVWIFSKMFFFAELYLSMAIYICFPLLGVSYLLYMAIKKKVIKDSLEFKPSNFFRNISVCFGQIFLYTLLTTLVYIASFSAFFYVTKSLGYHSLTKM